MKRIILIIVWLHSIALLNNLFGQNAGEQINTKYPAEELTVHLSQQCVFSGEVLWFKIYCTSPLFPEEELSRMAYIELVSDENEALMRKKILLKGGEGDGEFVVPENIQTGVYHLIAYTNWMKNFGEENFFRSTVTIINPNEEFDFPENEGVPTEITSSEKSREKGNPQEVRVMTDKKEYETREKVKLKLETGKEQGGFSGGKFSVAVCRKEPIQLVNGKVNTTVNKPELPKFINYLPDYKGIRLTGNITDDSGSPMSGEQVILSYPGHGTDINGTITNATGDFHFLLKPDEGEKDIVLTLSKPNLKLRLEEPFWNGFRTPPTNNLLKPNPEAIAFLKEKYAHFQLQKNFKQQNFTKNILSEPHRNNDRRFYDKASHVIELSEYIKLDSLTEYFWELIPSVRFIKRRGHFDLSVMNLVTYFSFEDAPGVFIDGVPYNDYNQIAAIPVDKVRQIAVIDKTYYYRDFTFGGIVDIHTKTGEFNTVKALPEMIRVIYPLGAKAETTHLTPDYANSQPSVNIPDLRYLICWQPDLTINVNGEATVEFYTGDIEGEYVITCAGISNDGKILHCESEITVESK